VNPLCKAIAALLLTAAFLPAAAVADGVPPAGREEDRGGFAAGDAPGALGPLWGRPARDALLLGMWSLHMDGSGELFGSGENNEENHLFGLQVAGMTAGTFINSHHRRSFFGGVARELYSRPLADALRFDLGYKAGIMSGYGPEFPDLAGLTAFIAAFAGISWNRLGFDLGLTPLGVWTFSFRLDIDGWLEGW